MQFTGTLTKQTIQNVFGVQCTTTWGEKRGTRHFWPTTTVTMTYAAATKRLRAAHGPQARFKRMDQAGVECWAAVDCEDSRGHILTLRIGKPDWAALLHEAL